MALRTPAFNDSKTYGFEWLRALLEISCQEGVVNAGDFGVTPAAGGGMRVDVAAGLALIKGDSGVPGIGLSQGLFFAVNDAAIPNAVTLTAAHASLPRIDQIVLRVRDSQDLGTGADDLTLMSVDGVATSGATLDNRNGAVALPNDCIRLCDVLVPAASAATTSANMRDRRTWARGAYSKTVRTQNAAAGNDYSMASGTATDIDATNLKPRIELSGSATVRVSLRGAYAHNTAGGVLIIQPTIDGNAVEAGPMTDEFPLRPRDAGLTTYNGFLFSWDFGLPAAGSHLFSWSWRTLTGTAVFAANINQMLELTVEELVRQNARNNVTIG